MGKKMGKKKEIFQQRQEVKAADASVAAANAKADIMADFPAFTKYDRKGLCLQLVSVSGSDLSAEDKASITQLLNVNMAPVYGPRWASVQKQKRREMTDPDARYIMLMATAPEEAASPAPPTTPPPTEGTPPQAPDAPDSRDPQSTTAAAAAGAPTREPSTASTATQSGGSDPAPPQTTGVCETAPSQTSPVADGAVSSPQGQPGGADRPSPLPQTGRASASPVGFAHFRFVVEEDVVPVLYVYELQLRPEVTGRGLGRFVMQFLELVARKNGMKAVMLTVQKSNERARKFYEEVAKFRISPTCPSFCDPLESDDYDYEIMCKVFDQDSLEKLKGSVPLTL